MKKNDTTFTGYFENIMHHITKKILLFKNLENNAFPE